MKVMQISLSNSIHHALTQFQEVLKCVLLDKGNIPNLPKITNHQTLLYSKKHNRKECLQNHYTFRYLVWLSKIILGLLSISIRLESRKSSMKPLLLQLPRRKVSRLITVTNVPVNCSLRGWKLSISLPLLRTYYVLIHTKPMFKILNLLPSLRCNLFSLNP